MESQAKRKNPNRTVPVEVRRLNGNAGRRPMPKEIKMPRQLVASPKYFNQEKRKIWKFILSETPPGMISTADSAILESYVNAVAIYRLAAMQMQDEALLVEDSNGQIKANPLLQIMERYSTKVLALSRVLGLTPLARITMSVAMSAVNLDKAIEKKGIDAILD